MTDWETWLRAAAEPPSDNEKSKRDRTEQQIRDALSVYEPLQGRPYRVYTKGSYANNTNVRLNFDVDIAVEYEGYFYYDMMFELEGKDGSTIGVVGSTDPYTRNEFKRDIKGALVQAFGASAVTSGNIAIRVREGKTTLPADVVPCWEYRRYDGLSSIGTPIFHKGSRVYPTSGGHKNNFPEIQQSNGRAKNIRTNKRYKKMVRALKKLQTRMLDEGAITKELPSYLIECIVYNVPDNWFGNPTYLADMRAVLATIFNATFATSDCNDWLEVHELRYLFRSGDFSKTDVHNLVSKAWDYLGLE